MKYLSLLALLLTACTLPLPGQSANIVAPSRVAALVLAVIDGDTLEVQIGTQTERVRLIGIDTPETRHPTRGVECFGREATRRTTEFAAGAQVQLEADPSQDDRDRYRRLLRFVWLPDGQLLNEQLVAEGFAFEYTYDAAYAYQARFRAAQQTARTEGRGLWSASTCAGQAAAAPGAAIATNVPATAPIVPTPAPVAPGTPSFRSCAADPNAAMAPNTPLQIVAIDKRAETATLRNTSAARVDLAGWILCSVRGTQRHPLAGVIAPGGEIVLPSGGSIWSNSAPDPAQLYDPRGVLVSATQQ